jgi:hypothetical protein
MAGSDSSLTYTAPGDFAPPEEQPTGRIIDPRSLIGNALWKGAKSSAEALWPLIKGPGQVLEGSLVPSMEPGPNQLSIPEYALSLGAAGMGARGLGFAAPEGALPTFPAFHGTGSSQVFRNFDDEYIGSGEGAQTYGWGHYVAGARKTGETYRQKLAGRGPVPLGDNGFPLSDAEMLQKYYEPGSIVPAYGGFDRVESFQAEHPSYPGQGLWSVNVKSVYPDKDAMRAKYGGATDRGGEFAVPPDALNDPSLWMNAHNKEFENVGLVSKLRNHATFPSTRDVASVGNAKGWDMGDPGGLLHINVIPDEHELLDHDLPWAQQDPGVQRKLTEAGLSPSNVDPQDIVPRRTPSLDMMTGGDLYKGLVDKHLAEVQDEAGRAAQWTPRPSRDDAKYAVSKIMDKAGVPGIKFLDQFSRGREYAEELKHTAGFDTAPNPDFAKNMMQGYPTYGRTVDEDLDLIRNQLKGNMPVGRGSREVIEHAKNSEDLLNWIDKEHQAGNFSIGDSRTRNYVLFDPRHLEIKTWNGIPLTPVDHDPFMDPTLGGLK